MDAPGVASVIRNNHRTVGHRMNTMAGRRKPPSAKRLMLVFALSATFAATAQTIPDESPVSGQQDLVDPEFSRTRGEITWVDNQGALWTAGVDPATGLFVPADGKGTLIDPDAMATSELGIVGNGPEWVSTASGDQIVYTKFLAGMPRTRPNARLAWARPTRAGWRRQYLLPRQSPRAAPFASSDRRDPAPRISYVDPAWNHYWRNLDDPASEHLVPHYPVSRSQYYYALRFVEGERAAAFPAVVDGVQQVFYLDLDSGVETQLTHDTGQKDLTSRAWIWHAPEFGGDKAMLTVADEVELRVYRQTQGQSGWTLVRSIRTPSDGIIDSPEYFTYGGSSYVFFGASVPPSVDPTVLYLANIDAATPMLRQLTPDLPLRIRNDPEVFITNDGPWIYFNRQTIDPESGPHCLPCSEGVFRSYTGLAPRQ